MKKVTITTRAIYHKKASVTIDVPSHISGEEEIQNWLWDNEDLYTDELETNLSNAKYEYGFGLDEYNGMDELDSETETRYDVYEEKTYGGHL